VAKRWDRKRSLLAVIAKNRDRHFIFGELRRKIDPDLQRKFVGIVERCLRLAKIDLMRDTRDKLDKGKEKDGY
jgi:hypothetical protein